MKRLPSSAAERQRRRRARQRLGRRVVAVEVDAGALEDLLVWAGDIHPIEADDREAVARGLAAFVARACGLVTRDADDR